MTAMRRLPSLVLLAPVLFLALIGARNALLVVATARYLLPHLGAQRRPIEVEDRAAQQVA